MIPIAIRIEVPKSGWVITNKTGEIKATIGKNKNFNLLTSFVEFYDNIWLKKELKRFS